jgi:hypothetical protein
MTAERRHSMLLAVESAQGLDSLKELVQRYLNEGIGADLLVDDLDQTRTLVSDEVEETVLEVMDLLVGWCAPKFRLVRRQEEPPG